MTNNPKITLEKVENQVAIQAENANFKTYINMFFNGIEGVCKSSGEDFIKILEVALSKEKHKCGDYDEVKVLKRGDDVELTVDTKGAEVAVNMLLNAIMVIAEDKEIDPIELFGDTLNRLAEIRKEQNK